VASDPVQPSLALKEKRTDFLSGMLERVGLGELGRFLRIDFCDAKLDDACSGSKGTGLLLSIPMSDGYLDGAEDTDVALGLVGTLEGESLDG
jgi:hypothetical protein